MLGTYYQGQTAILFVNFLYLFGSEPSSVTDAKITIKHVDSSSPVVDINAANLVNITSSEYYYQWDIPADAFTGDYMALFSATIEGEYSESLQTFQVLNSTQAAVAGITAHYTTKAAVVQILGPDYTIADVPDEFLSFADGLIDDMLQMTYRTTITVTSEKHDIPNNSTPAIFLKNYPVISVDWVKDSGIALDADSYLVYNDTGVIKIVDDYYWSTVLGTQGYFSKGRQKVEVKYSYGSVSIPSLLTYWASLIVSDLVASVGTSSTAGTLQQEKIGDYQYKNAFGEDSPRAQEIKKIQEIAIAKYSNHPKTRDVNGI